LPFERPRSTFIASSHVLCMAECLRLHFFSSDRWLAR
jgi:hypothetical protein